MEQDDSEIDAISGQELKENSYLSPKEAFRKFDTDNSGTIDEDEFFHLLESVGIEENEEYQERMFRKYLKPGSREIKYEGFKKAWLLLGNPTKELVERGIPNLPKFASRHQLVGILENVLDDEERLEALAKAEADRWQKLQERTNLRREYIRKAKEQAGLELGAALDAAGQVYVIGKGANEQFSGKPKKEMSTSSFQQVGFDLLQSLWDGRVSNVAESNAYCRANCITVGVWGRRPRKVAFTDNTIFALTDIGILAWGGNSNWWHDFSNGYTMNKTPRSQTTPRSSALLMIDEHMHQKHLAIIQEDIDEKVGVANHEMRQMKRVLKYYGEWPMHFDGTNDVEMVRNHLLANVSYDQILHSLLIRGKPCYGHGLSKLEISQMLSEDILLETEILGEEGHQHLCDTELEIVNLTERKKTKSANHLKLLNNRPPFEQNRYGEPSRQKRKNKKRNVTVTTSWILTLRNGMHVDWR